MVAIGAVLVVVSLSVLATRLGAIALGATGLSWEAASFQARSAFTGVGFTTSEAESITGHAARRRVVSWLMFLGNAGIVSIIASLVLGFADAGAREATQRLGVLVAGLLVLLALVRSRWLTPRLRRSMERWLTRLSAADVRDYVHLLHISDDYSVHETVVSENSWLADQTLRELDLPREGVLVLGVRREGGGYLGAPGPDTRLCPGDVAVLYGHDEALTELDDRPQGSEGESERNRSVGRHTRQQAEEAARDDAGPTDHSSRPRPGRDEDHGGG